MRIETISISSLFSYINVDSENFSTPGMDINLVYHKVIVYKKDYHDILKYLKLVK